MKKLLLAVLVLTWTAEAVHAGSRITYDNQCISIDGKDVVIFSGAFHYFRCPKELWHDRFTKLKEAGFNTVETYAAWNYHEQSPPKDVDDFSKLDMTDLHDWLAMATDEFGFNAILRPGPYICAEWDGGGYPQWLITKKPADFTKTWFRSDEPMYLAWSKHWYTAVAKVAVPFLITNRPAGKAGIILWQIENEYNYSSQPIDVKKNQLDFLAHTSRDLGIDVPLTTCMTSSDVFRADDYLKENVIESRNTYPKYSIPSMEKDIGALDTYQPEKFRMITELQGGWFSQVGGKLSEEQGFKADQINHITLYAWERGFTATNYYMAFGGTNFGDWAAAGITTSYDYDAPVRESGGVTQRYPAVKALGNFINEHGWRLVRSIPIKFETKQKLDSDVNVVLRYCTDGSLFAFLRTEQRDSARNGTMVLQPEIPTIPKLTIHYTLDPFGSKVLYLPAWAKSDADGAWYPKPADGPHRPGEVPAPVLITETKMRSDPGPATWKKLQPGQSEEDAGIFHRGFVYYRTIVPNSDQPLALSLTMRDHDWAGFVVDGKVISCTSGESQPVQANQELVGLYENYGRVNGGDMDRTGGMQDMRIGVTLGHPQPINDWRMKIVKGGKHAVELSPDTNDSGWSKPDINASDGPLGENQNAVYRATIQLSDDDLKTGKSLYLGRVDDEGVVYVNTQKVGECHDWDRAYQFDISKNLHAGKNLIAVVVTNHDGVGGMSHGARLESTGPGMDAKWEISDQPAGVAGKWWENLFDDSIWKTMPLESTNSQSLLTWYRMKFELPDPKPEAWVPWKLHFDAMGNGFLYLNGHPLGRWWQVGPQKDFYLPECWLNFGKGKVNILTVCLRPTESAGIKSAQVEPYADQAEER